METNPHAIAGEVYELYQRGESVTHCPAISLTFGLVTSRILVAQGVGGRRNVAELNSRLTSRREHLVGRTADINTARQESSGGVVRY